MHKFKENVNVTVGRGAVGTSTTSTVSTGTGVDMKNYNNFAGIITAGIQAGGGPLTAYIVESTDNATFNQDKYVATLAISSATSPLIGYGGVIECRADQMTDGYRYLRVDVLPTTGTGNVLMVSNVRFNSRFSQATLP